MKIYKFLFLFIFYLSYSQDEVSSLNAIVADLNVGSRKFSIEQTSQLKINKEIDLIEIAKYDGITLYYPFYKASVNSISNGEGIASGDHLIILLEDLKKFVMVNYFSGFYLAKVDESMFELHCNLQQEQLDSNMVVFDMEFLPEALINIKSEYHMKRLDVTYKKNTSYFSVFYCDSFHTSLEFNERFLYQSTNFRNLMHLILGKVVDLKAKPCNDIKAISEKAILPNWIK